MTLAVVAVLLATLITTVVITGMRSSRFICDELTFEQEKRINLSAADFVRIDVTQYIFYMEERSTIGGEKTDSYDWYSFHAGNRLCSDRVMRHFPSTDSIQF